MASRPRLKNVLGLGAARVGSRDWLMQRLTAVAGIPLAVFFVFFMTKMGNLSYLAALSFVRSFPISLGLILGICVFSWHMRLGMHVVLEDYLHHKGMKFIALGFNALWCFFWAFCGIYAVVRIGWSG